MTLGDLSDRRRRDCRARGWAAQGPDARADQRPGGVIGTGINWNHWSPSIGTGGRHQLDWSSSIGAGGRHHVVRAPASSWAPSSPTAGWQHNRGHRGSEQDDKCRARSEDWSWRSSPPLIVLDSCSSSQSTPHSPTDAIKAAPTSPKSCKRPSIPAHAAAAAWASSRPWRATAPSTAQPHNDNLRAIAAKSRLPVCSLLSRPRLYTDLPLLLVAGGVIGIKAGQHIGYPSRTPMSNLLLTMLDKAGVPGVDKLGDTTGRLELVASVISPLEQGHRRALSRTSSVRPFDPIRRSPPSLPQRLQRRRGPKDGTVASSGQSSILTARSWPQCWRVTNNPRTPWRRMPPSVIGLVLHPEPWPK